MELHQSSRLIQLFDVAPGVIAAYETSDPGSADTLAPGDYDPTSHRMGANRLAEFAAGRACARKALADVGIEAPSLPIGPGRAPAWPEGVRGSITHTRDYRGAVAARTRDLGGAALGIDADSTGRVTTKLWSRLFVDAEIDYLGHIEDVADTDRMATVMFSAKEAFYKAQYPLTEAWVGFGDVRITVEPDRLILEPFSDLDALRSLNWPIQARWHCDDSLVLTGLIVEPVGR